MPLIYGMSGDRPDKPDTVRIKHDEGLPFRVFFGPGYIQVTAMTTADATRTKLAHEVSAGANFIQVE